MKKKPVSHFPCASSTQARYIIPNINLASRLFNGFDSRFRGTLYCYRTGFIHTYICMNTCMCVHIHMSQRVLGNYENLQSFDFT